MSTLMLNLKNTVQIRLKTVGWLAVLAYSLVCWVWLLEAVL